MADTTGDTLRREAFTRFTTNPWSAHEALFRHRHPDPSSDAHREFVRRIYAPDSRLSVEAFRGFGKSTTLEETALIRAGLRRYRYMVIVGASYGQACQRLAAIKNEIVVNEWLEKIFGPLKGNDVWQEGMIVLASGICIQALGRDQSMLGMKYQDTRPDAALIDDVEDPNEIRTDMDREKTWTWLIKTFLPSLADPLTSWVRVLGTRRGRGSLPERLELAGWPTVKFPIEYLDAAGNRTATWPGKFPLDKIDEMKRLYRGDLHTWMQEYMCRADAESARTFTREMFKVSPRVRSWQATYAMYDPARTKTTTSASTGKAVWSWIGHKLVFWALEAHLWLPSEMIDDMFETAQRFDLVQLGFEETGLNEWAKQPIRAEQTRRRVLLPLRPVNAPRGKLDFIKSLQAHAADIELAGDPAQFAEAIDQFVSFPRGRIDAPNAAAYALTLRPGSPVYDSFSDINIDDDLMSIANAPLYLAANADGAVVTAVLMQRSQGEIRILADWVREGTPFEVVGDIHAEAQLQAQATTRGTRTLYGSGENMFKRPLVVPVTLKTPVTWVVPPWHMDTWRNVGLVQAIRTIPQTVSPGAAAALGRPALGALLEQLSRGRPRVLASGEAHWTLRAFTGGYCRRLGVRGGMAIPGAEPEDGIYKVLMEGVEGFVGVGLRETSDDEATEQPLATNKHGMLYRSALPQGRAERR